ncbi:hypothetical protein D8674_032574 [Pyrus ussuriensis x Pyrus communis]|uniref:AB hydrolase-1 domain-containing protein n=1 Tax=Pyrus ussuriensis x Pyrus communis TaxID=2448454 RepID=A0A5N5HIF3_9ROSA|nr:hypothetical protein D8674_032574 [Pyrus ussuriensis x Pyrus communis]
MLPFFLSPVSLYAIYVRRCFAGSGLSQQTLQLNNDQTTLHFWGPNPKLSNQTQNPEKPSLVLIHGFGPAAMWQWRNQVQFFSPHFNIYVPNLVFFGNSTTASPERTEVFQASSVAKMMEKVGVERFSVMGTSYGGFVAYHLARMWPERVEKVVIASSGVNMRRGDHEALLKRAKLEKIEDLMLPSTAAQLNKLLNLAMARRLDIIPDFFLSDIIQKLYSDKRKEKMELLKGLTLGREDTPNISPLPNKEVLIVWGEKDQIFPLEMATELKELLGPKTKLEVIKNTSHVPQVENPAQFNNIVKSYLCDS